MHKFLETIGFRFENKTEFKKILQNVRDHYTHQTIVSYSGETDYCELKKEYGQGIGIAICGELNQEEEFDDEFYFPYFEGTGVSTYADVIVESRYEREQYFGICEDPRVGISLIFFLQNGIEFMKEKQLGLQEGLSTSITFAALSLKGKILFPVQKDVKFMEEDAKATDQRRHLITAARGGDQTAIESLTMSDIDMYSKVSMRLVNEDVFSIVDTYLMPYGVECDLYSILGEILAIRERENFVTKEKLYQMKLEVNEMQIDLCIPKDNLLGEPQIGRRFKGNIWLQGMINY